VYSTYLYNAILPGLVQRFAVKVSFSTMRHAVILAGGSGTRLWPMSTGAQPKQILPLMNGRSLLDLAFQRMEGLVPAERRWVCAAETHRAAIRKALPGLLPENYLGEPVGRDTLAALAYASAVIARKDPEASIMVLTADHLIEPADTFRLVAGRGLDAAESGQAVLVTFGIAPTYAATGFGYLRLGEPFLAQARVVEEFREKPDTATAEGWVREGPQRYLWNSGLFAWKAAAFLDCVKRYEPAAYDGARRVAEAWDTPGFTQVISEIYPGLKKISVDFAVMEKASRDPAVKVAAVPMALSWKDIGSWPAFAETCPMDDEGNSLAAVKNVLLDTRGTLVVSSDPEHLIAAFGCEEMVIVHTARATLVCRKDKADELKRLHALAAEKFGTEYV
jgi:mannose-1-phosphate guanylyltransferase